MLARSQHDSRRCVRGFELRTRLITARVLLVPNSATLAWSSSRGAPLATAAEM